MKRRSFTPLSPFISLRDPHPSLPPLTSTSTISHSAPCLRALEGEHKSQDTKEIGVEERTQPFQQMSVKGRDVMGAGVEGPGVLRAAGRVNTILSPTKAGYNRRRVTRPRDSSAAPPVPSHRCFCQSALSFLICSFYSLLCLHSSLTLSQRYCLLSLYHNLWPER